MDGRTGGSSRGATNDGGRKATSSGGSGGGRGMEGSHVTWNSTIALRKLRSGGFGGGGVGLSGFVSPSMMTTLDGLPWLRHDFVSPSMSPNHCFITVKAPFNAFGNGEGPNTEAGEALAESEPAKGARWVSQRISEPEKADLELFGIRVDGAGSLKTSMTSETGLVAESVVPSSRQGLELGTSRGTKTVTNGSESHGPETKRCVSR